MRAGSWWPLAASGSCKASAWLPGSFMSGQIRRAVNSGCPLRECGSLAKLDS